MGRSLTGAATIALAQMPDRVSALAIARSLLAACLAACVSVGGRSNHSITGAAKSKLPKTAQETLVAIETQDARDALGQVRERDPLTTGCRQAEPAPS